MSLTGRPAFVQADWDLFGLTRRLWQELFEIFQQIGSRVEKGGNLSINILYRLLLSLIGLEDFEKLFIYLRFILETILQNTD